MTKPRRRTQKIHRKRRGSRRGFKSRSQRGGVFEWSDLMFWKKKDPLLSNDYQNSLDESMPKSQYENTNEVINPMQQPATPPMQQPAALPMQQSPFSMGGRKRCKRHHKHSRRCKK